VVLLIEAIVPMKTWRPKPGVDGVEVKRFHEGGQSPRRDADDVGLNIFASCLVTEIPGPP